ncbi:LLM class flavin-dependent oxidoreductase [Pendulispora rubella]|uniref:LLM class flavin-dependent oxidoreductase n=1 Tax=Pendulispora rubella TaxID=2741070 RepID=A0ABZ2L268_9BACT
MSLVLNVLDQSPVFAGQSPVEAIRDTVRLACEVERLGYRRFWVSEHHGAHAFASAAPEIMTARVASATSRLRVGAGGVLLRYYSALKVVEQFHALEAMFPGRIDLGIGRTTGAAPRAALALTAQEGRGRRSSVPDFAERVDALLGYLADGVHERVDAVPHVPSPPQPWILGTSPESARFAAVRGLPYAFGAFIPSRNMDETLAVYKSEFVPSKWLKEPYINVALFVLCAETEEHAFELASSTEAWFVQSLLRMNNIPFPTVDEAMAAAKSGYGSCSEHELQALEARRQAVVVGNPAQVASRLHALTANGLVRELTLVTIAERFEDRLESYRRIAEVCT